MTEDERKDAAVECAQGISKYAFMLSFALSFPKDEALIHHNRECLNASVKELNELVDFDQD